MLEDSTRLFAVSIAMPKKPRIHRKRLDWMTSTCSDLWKHLSPNPASDWMAIKGHDQRTDQPVLKGATNDLSSLMKLPHTALDHLDVVRVASTEIHFGPIFLSWDVRVPPDLEEFDNTLEMYRLDTGVIVRRSHVKLQGAPQPRLIITAPNFGLWQVTRLRIVRNP